MENFEQRSQKLDEQDILKHFKQEFFLPANKLYFSSHQLGPLSKRAKKAIEEQLLIWQESANGGWKRGWMELEDTITDKLSKVMLCNSEDIAISASLTIGLHVLLSTFYKPTKDRNKIVMLSSEFNSDIFASQSWVEIYGQPKDSLILANVSDTDQDITTNNVINIINQEKNKISIVAMSLVSNHFSHYYDMDKINKECKKYGILLFVDLAHALGCVPLNITKMDPDAAYLSTSKYLCSGAGNIGAFYINPRYKGIMPGLKGWFGTDRKIFTDQKIVYSPSPEGLKRFQISGFDPVHLARCDAQLSYFVDADITKVTAKTQQLKSYFIDLLSTLPNIQILNKKSPFSGHVAIRLIDTKLTTKEFQGFLFEEGNIMCDYHLRYDLIRFGIGSLYVSFSDVFQVFSRIKSMIDKHCLFVYKM